MPIISPSGTPFSSRAMELEQREREFMEPAELGALWRQTALHAFWNGYFRLQYHFGCRSSEVAILMKEDIDFAGGRIFIRRLKKRDGQGFSVHVYELPARLATTLRAVGAHVPAANPWFFGSHLRAVGEARVERMAAIRITDGGWRAVSRSSAQLHFQNFATRALVPVHLRHTHVLRHTRATLLFANGATEAEVQYILAHSSPVITRKYIGWASQMKDKASVAALLGDEDD